MNVEKLFNIIENRKKDLPKNSYIASLIKRGIDSVIQKIGEETIETIIAAKTSNKKRIIEEITDLLFHLLIFISISNVSLKEIYQELDRRNKSAINA